ncbi:MAG: TauD/TfdA family dioxygenase [Acidimicrobiia bacterium]
MTVAELPLVPVPAAPAGHRYERITVDPYTGVGGAVITGVNLADSLDDQTVAEIRRALLDHLVVFFRGQSLSSEQQAAVTHRFGPYSTVPFIEPLAEHPEVIAVVREATETQSFSFGGVWHSDFSFLPEPPAGSMLHALEIPPYGGDTLWANQYLAFDTLSVGLQTALRAIDGVHSARDAYSPKMQAVHDLFAGMTVHTSEDANRSQRHPVVRRHPETGREALYVNAQYTVGLADWWPAEQQPLLDFLFAHATQDSFTCRWRWAVGDVAFWDNRGAQHMVMGDVRGARRAMHRTTVAGDAPAR